MVYISAWLGAGSHSNSDETKGKEGELKIDDKAERGMSNTEKNKTNEAEPKPVNQTGKRKRFYFYPLQCVLIPIKHVVIAVKHLQMKTEKQKKETIKGKKRKKDKKKNKEKKGKLKK